MKNGNSIVIQKMIGGGDSWYYAIENNRVIGSAHEDDDVGMSKLNALRSKKNEY